MIANCYGEHAPFGPAFSGFSVSAFRSLLVSFELVTTDKVVQQVNTEDVRVVKSIYDGRVFGYKRYIC